MTENDFRSHVSLAGLKERHNEFDRSTSNKKPPPSQKHNPYLIKERKNTPSEK